MRRGRSPIRITGRRVHVGRRPGRRPIPRLIRRPIHLRRGRHGGRRGCLGLLPGCLVSLFLVVLAATALRLAVRVE